MAVKPDPKAVERILASKDFKAVTDKMRADYTAQVMAPNVPDEIALVARREYAALERMLEALKQAARG